MAFSLPTLTKAHVSAYTKKDGTYVAAHEDKRVGAPSFKPGDKVVDKWGDKAVVVGPDPKDPSRIMVKEGGSSFSSPAANYRHDKPKPMTQPNKVGASGIRWPESGKEPVILFHNSDQKDEFTVRASYPGNVFDGVFAGPNAGMDGKHRHAFAIDPEKIMTHYEFRHNVPYQSYRDAIRQLHPDWTDDQAERAWDYVAEDKEADDGESGDLFGSDDVDLPSWKAQGLRGAVARLLGYHAVEMNDETGVSTQVLAGAKSIPLKDGESFDNAARRLHSVWEDESKTMKKSILILSGKNEVNLRPFANK